MAYKLTSDDVDLIQFNGRYQLQSQSPCCCCKLGLLNPEALRVTGLIGKGRSTCWTLATTRRASL